MGVGQFRPFPPLGGPDGGTHEVRVGLAGGGWQDSHSPTAAARLYLRAAGSEKKEEKEEKANKERVLWLVAI